MADYTNYSDEELLQEYARTKALKSLEIERAANQQKIAELENEARLYQLGGTIASSIAQGIAPFGLGTWSDELLSAIEAPFSDRTYAEIQAEKERQLAAGREAFPAAALISEIGASLVSGGLLKKALQSLPALKTILEKDAVRRAMNIGEATITGAGSAGMDQRGTGALLGGALGTGFEALGGGLARTANILGGSEKLQSIGQKLGRESIGLRLKDYLAGGINKGYAEADKALLEAGEGLLENPQRNLRIKLEDTTNKLMSEGRLPQTRNPSELAGFVETQLDLLGDARGKIVKEYDDIFDEYNRKLAAENQAARYAPERKSLRLTRKPIKTAAPKQAAYIGAEFPDLTKWKEEIETTGKLNPDEKAELIKFADDLQKQHAERSTERLKHLIEIKKQVSDTAFDVNKVAPGTIKQNFYNQLYYRLQDATNNVAQGKSRDIPGLNLITKTPEEKVALIKKLNSLGVQIGKKTADISDYKAIQAPLRYQAVKDSAETLASKAQNLFNTTGGAGAFLLSGGLGALGGGGIGYVDDESLGGSLLGALFGLGYRGAAGNRNMQKVLSDYLTGAAKNIKAGQLPESITAEALKQSAIRRAAVPETDALIPQAEAAQTSPTDFSKFTDEELLQEYSRLKTKNQAPVEDFSNKDLSKKENLDAYIASKDSLIRAMIQTESAGNPNAKSKRGAVGLMQLMLNTAKELGVKDRFDPIENVNAGTKYFNEQLDTFKDKSLALAAYNWGPANIKKAIKNVKAKGLKPSWQNILENEYVPLETRKYVDKVLLRETKYGK